MAVTAELFETIRRIFRDGIPFNRFLQLELEAIDSGRAVISVPFLADYVGDLPKGIVHGGIISTLIDTTGGATAFSVLEYPFEIGVNTVDMRVDYLRMGRGERFIATGTVLRRGRRIVSTVVEVHNEAGLLIAHGTAAYSIFNQHMVAKSKERRAKRSDADDGANDASVSPRRRDPNTGTDTLRAYFEDHFDGNPRPVGVDPTSNDDSDNRTVEPNED